MQVQKRTWLVSWSVHYFVITVTQRWSSLFLSQVVESVLKMAENSLTMTDLLFFNDILRNKFLFKRHGSHREQNVLNESYILFIKRKKNQNINKVINNHLDFQLYFRPSKTLLFVSSNLTITAWRPSIRWNILKTIRLLIPQVISGSWIN